MICTKKWRSSSYHQLSKNFLDTVRTKEELEQQLQFLSGVAGLGSFQLPPAGILHPVPVEVGKKSRATHCRIFTLAVDGKIKPTAAAVSKAGERLSDSVHKRELCLKAIRDSAEAWSWPAVAVACGDTQVVPPHAKLRFGGSCGGIHRVE
mmetsp:Transcript_32424/g.91889  ORF Transcript_32424/g.91889 Transcript_32424/m.91889 type:complete len:150 (+) Transcript_32424:887-1336(+)